MSGLEKKEDWRLALPCLHSNEGLEKAGERGRKKAKLGGKANAFQESGDSRCGLSEYIAIREQVRSTSYFGPCKPSTGGLELEEFCDAGIVYTHKRP